jgi:hypothetical protein
MPREEVLLMVFAILLYLYDSAQLLHFNEGILFPAGRKGWRVRFGSDNTRLRGKELYLPNPFVPHRPLFRLAWDLQGSAVRVDEDWSARKALFRPLVPLVWGMAIGAFVLLPLGLFTPLGDAMVLAAIGLLYLNIVAALVWLGWRRQRFGLAAGRYAALAAESLLCSPFALNLIRKLALQMPAREDLLHAAQRLQSPEDWDAFRLKCVGRLDERIEDEEPDSARLPSLQEQRRTLAGEEAR